MKKMARREFLAAGAAACCGLALTGCATKAQNPSAGEKQTSQKWDESFDVVVVGGGGAGLTAAIAAAQADSNASILVIEKRPATGGNTAMCGGNIGAMGTDVILAAGEKNGNEIFLNDTTELYYEDKLATGDYAAEPELARVFAENSHDNYEWLVSLGMNWSTSKSYENKMYRPSDLDNALLLGSSVYLHRYDKDGEFKGVSRKTRYNSGGSYNEYSRGAAIAKCLADAAESFANIEIRLECPLTGIVREQPNAGDVLGITVKQESGEKSIQAKRGVVLACGGYSANGEMINRYDRKVPASIRPSGNESNTGDGLIAAQWLGGQVVNMSFPQIDFGNPKKFYVSFSGRKALAIFPSPANYIDLGPDGNRIWNELPNKAPQYVDAKLTRLNQLGIDSWWSLGDATSVLEDELTEEDVKDFTDNIGAVCNTLDEVAKYIGCDAATLKKTVENYNSYVDAQVDADYGKSAFYLKQKIETAPFYVFEATISCLSTPGGLRINTDAQVMDIENQPISRLYAAGEITGNVHGRFRNSGGDSMTDNTCFGRIAGTNVAVLSPIA